MDVTLILCTYNRCESLARALDSIMASALPESVEWEILVVDNNSRDCTRVTVEDFCRRYPHRIRYIFEPQQGKSYALNTGIREAKGKILVFTDDDIIAQLTWLGNLTDALRYGYAGAAGRVLPPDNFSPPRWLASEGKYSLIGILALFDLGVTPGELHRAPVGANMAFRKEVFEKYGGFRTDLGPRPGSALRHEDSEFCSRLIAAGERIRYEPSAVVFHAVPENRLTKEYFLEWAFAQGRASVLEYGRGRDVLGIPRPYLSLLKAFLEAVVCGTMRWMLTLTPYRRFFYKFFVWMAAGRIVEFYRLARIGEQ